MNWPRHSYVSFVTMYRNEKQSSLSYEYVLPHIQLFQLRLSKAEKFLSKAEKSNTSAKSLLGVMIKNTQNNIQFLGIRSRDLHS